MNPIIDKFFALGDKVSNGDIVKKARFDYYLLWIIFLAFTLVVYGNIRTFFDTGRLQYIGWALVIICILYFQYFTLRQSRQALFQLEEFHKNRKSQDKNEEKIESPDEMLKEFDK